MSVFVLSAAAQYSTTGVRFGNVYYENLNPEDEIPGRHRWVDFAQHFNNATQVPPEWHSWLSHIRQLPPTEDNVMKNMSPPWKAVCVNLVQTMISHS
ncbi:hypothetical protein CONPUDRAFT_153379 [Coniophora puteana RWD-64-598 SS2]|uniref:NADH dehydrogenase [ubiquinone] 1 alpha subcomplex subunit n=1 Tax=Coniophora puteana (strain RWD-64-598) TaxID=741705 RepID=A0A5M3MUV7_CONPW|nr:uncharacterized protein CONPUDRAFT_153379 [Coniophora puteana RWD-64-598 SS2]EIW82505.1 hypothetical protein CONPUDRAFT_153379 [Coniophora puteana RWD-64-598 SS2]